MYIRRANMIILVFVVLLVVSISGAALAAPKNDETKGTPNSVVVAIDRANTQLDMAIEKAVDQGADAKSDKQLDKIIERLYKKEDRILDQVNRFIDRSDIEVEFVEETIMIGDRSVTIDPIKVWEL